MKTALFLFIFSAMLSLLSSSMSFAATEKDFAGKRCGNTGNALFCMVCNIYFESRGEPFAGKVAVGRTVLTRHEKEIFGESICEIVHRPWQFSWTLDGTPRLPKSGPNYAALKESVRAAKIAMKLGPNGATHFHASYVKPRWARRCQRSTLYTADKAKPKKLAQAELGDHRFYACTAQIDDEMQALAQHASAGPNSGWEMPRAMSGAFNSPGEETDPDLEW